MFCPTCGKENPDNAKICGYCGVPITVLPQTKEPEKTVEPAPTEPIAPIAPAEPIAPVAPAEPIAPVAPAEPIAPVSPAEPIAPAEPQEEKKSHKGLIITLSSVGAAVLIIGTAFLLYSLGVFDKKAGPTEDINSLVSSAANESSAIIAGADDYYSSYISANSSEESEASSEASSTAPEISSEGKEEPNYKPNPASALIGKWKGNYDLSELVGMEAELPVTIEFKSDNTFSMKVEEEDLAALCEKVLELSAEMAGVTTDEVLEQAGITMDEYIESAKSQMGDVMEMKGTYNVSGNKLYTAAEGEDLAEVEPIDFSIENDTLEISIEGVELQMNRIV